MVRLSFETHQRLIARDEARDEARGFAGIDEQGLSVRFLLDATEASPEAVAALHRPVGPLSSAGPAHSQPFHGRDATLPDGRALLFNPRLLILDEPFDGLDASMRRYLADHHGAGAGRAADHPGHPP
jgi:hypothetical protein